MKKMKIGNSKLWYSLMLALAIGFTSISCSSGNKEEGEENNYTSLEEVEAEAEAEAEAAPEYGVGPVQEVDLGAEIDAALAEKGKSIFEAKCSACHKFDQRYVGPALAGVTERRHAAWVMNMIINPQEMTQKDPIAKKLLAEYMTQMVAQDVTQDDARALLEYFRQVDSQN